MDFKELSEYSPSLGYYNLKDKFANYVTDKSVEAFNRADNIRNSVKTKEEFFEYKKNARETLKKVIGWLPYDKNLPFNARITGVIREENLIIEKIIFQSREGIYVTANLYIPKDGKEKHPAILFQMGHAAEGKAAGAYQKAARVHAMCGFAVFAFDPIGQGERLSYVENGKIKIAPCIYEHQYTGNQCYLTDTGFTKYFITDAMRAIDYMETREDLDLSMLGAIGNSGGGTMSSTIMAYDDRIKIAAPSCFLTTRKDYFYAGGAQDAEQIWFGATRDNFDHYELVSSFCPNPLLIVTVDSDFFPVEGSVRLYEKEKEFYKLCGCENNIRMVTDQSTHTYTLKNAIKSAEFFTEFVLGKQVKLDFDEIPVVNEKDLWCTGTGNILDEIPDGKIIFEENLERYNSIAPKTKEEKKKFFNDRIFNNRKDIKLYLKKIREEEVEGLNAALYVWYSQEQMPNYAVALCKKELKGSKLPVKLFLFENGTNDMLKYKNEVIKSTEEGNLVFILDLTATGKCEPHLLYTGKEVRGEYGAVEKLSKDLFYLGDSLCAIKLYDLLKAIKLLREKFDADDLTLHSFDMATVYSKIVEILDDTIKTECTNEFVIENLVKNKYYYDKIISDILMPEIAVYLK